MLASIEACANSSHQMEFHVVAPSSSASRCSISSEQALVLPIRTDDLAPALPTSRCDGQQTRHEQQNDEHVQVEQQQHRQPQQTRLPGFVHILRAQLAQVREPVWADPGMLEQDRHCFSSRGDARLPHVDIMILPEFQPGRQGQLAQTVAIDERTWT